MLEKVEWDGKIKKIYKTSHLEKNKKETQNPTSYKYSVGINFNNLEKVTLELLERGFEV